MKTPVIIPAYNEEVQLAATLHRLPADSAEPLVVVNGSTDATRAVAEGFGVTTYEINEQGKMLAIQKALRHLGGQALEPLIILDADTRPLFPRAWVRGMHRSVLASDQPEATGGPVFYVGSPMNEQLLRTAYRAARAQIYSHDETIERALQFGPNMAIKLQTPATLDDVMELPNYWPGEDRAIVQAVLDNDGSYHPLIHPSLTTLTPTSVSAMALKDRLRLGAEQTRHTIEQRYIERGAAGSVPYNS